MHSKPRHLTGVTATAVFAGSMVGFALSAHRAEWVAVKFGGLAAACVSLCVAWAIMEHPWRTTIGAPSRSHPVLRAAMVGVLGIPAAIGFRLLLETSVFPYSLHWFAVAAMAVGFMEELVWRGWMQGLLSDTLGPGWAVPLAAMSHTAYKTALFSFPPPEIPMRSFGSLVMIACLTFGFGAMLGIFRARQGSLAPAVAFHVVFDLLVYGSLPTAPWWVY